MLKRIFFILLIASVVIILPSCNYEITQLSDRLIIEAIGVDKTETGWKISVQTLDTKQSGSSASPESKEDISQTYISEGDTVSQAMDKLMISVGQETLYSQTRVLIIGKEAARTDISLLLDYFLREYTTRDDTMLAIADDDAETIVSANLGESTLGAKIIEHEIEIGERNGLSVQMPMFCFINLLTGETDAAYAPVIQSKKADDGLDKLEVIGTAVFSDFELKVILNTEETTGLMLLNDLITNCVLSLELDDGVRTAVEIIKSHTDITVLSANNLLTADIGCRFSCDIIEYSNKRLEELTDEAIDEIKQKASEKAHELMQNTYNKAVKEHYCDISRLGRRLWRKYPELYAGYLEDKNSSLKEISEDITVQVSIRRAGKETVKH